MNFKLLITATAFVTMPVLALAEKDHPLEPTPKPTLEDFQKFVQTIIADKNKLQAYCDLGDQGQMDKAADENDTKAIDALVAKADALEGQLGLEYDSDLTCHHRSGSQAAGHQEGFGPSIRSLFSIPSALGPTWRFRCSGESSSITPRIPKSELFN
jgi:hypothetical protein